MCVGTVREAESEVHPNDLQERLYVVKFVDSNNPFEPPETAEGNVIHILYSTGLSTKYHHEDLVDDDFVNTAVNCAVAAYMSPNSTNEGVISKWEKEGGFDEQQVRRS